MTKHKQLSNIRYYIDSVTTDVASLLLWELLPMFTYPTKASLRKFLNEHVD